MTRFHKVAPRLPVESLSRTIAFYMGLGFRVDLLWPEDNPIFAILDQHEVSLQFYVPEAATPQPTGHATLNLDATDVAGLHRALADKMAVEWGPEVYGYGRREFAVRDPDGYLLIFSEPTEDPPTCEGS